MQHQPDDFRGQLCTAFENIQDKDALAWSILDTKSETAVVAALALQINRTGRLRARVEYPPRVDLVLLDQTVPVAAFEAKAAYVTDFQPARIDRRDWYLGGCVDEDIGKLGTLTARLPTLRYRAALFFLYEVAEPSRQLKYGTRPRVEQAVAKAALEANVASARLAESRSIDCGIVDGTSVRVHLLVFEPSSSVETERSF